MKKYKLLKNDFVVVNGEKLYRIQALKTIRKGTISEVKKGELGGYIEKESNLSHEGNCWVYDNAKVYNDAVVEGNGRVFDNACVYEKVKVSDGNVRENAKVYGGARVWGGDVSGNATLFGHAHIFNGEVCENAKVYGSAFIRS